MNKFLTGVLLVGAVVAVGTLVKRLLKGNSAENDYDDFDEDFYDEDDIDFEISDDDEEETEETAEEESADAVAEETPEDDE